MNQVQKNYVVSRVKMLLIALAVIGAVASAFMWYWVAVVEAGIMLLFWVSVAMIEVVDHYRYKWRVLAVTEPNEKDYFDRYFYRVKHELWINIDETCQTPEEIAYIKKIREIKKPALL